MTRMGCNGSRELSGQELRALAVSMGGRPENWAERVRHDPDERVFEQLYLDENVGVWLICWSAGHDTGFHDHDVSSGAFVVVRGALIEERLRFGVPPSSVLLEQGDSVHFDPTEIHRVFHAGDVPAVSIHAYSPPLMRMGSYLVEPGGALRRLSIGPTDELRPPVLDPG
jgi:mannose-6-phosphate isomerase-like protein (cupin superfamily)